MRTGLRCDSPVRAVCGGGHAATRQRATAGGGTVISPDTIEQIRARTDAVAILSESIPSLKRRGRSFVGLCPFHKEKTPSFHVNPDRGFFHCFGCKESGTVIDFLMKHDGLTFPEAVRGLAERIGVEVVEEHGVRTEVDRNRKMRDDLYAANNLAATFYEQQLREHPWHQLALDELTKRDLLPSWAGGGARPAVDDTLEKFRVGYAPPNWDSLTLFFKAQGVSPIVAESAGLLVPRSSGTGFYDRFRSRLMFPVRDIQGRVIAFSGRALAEPPSQGGGERADAGPPAKYINSPESPIYSKGGELFGLHQAKQAIRQEEFSILVEGNFDVVSLHARGLLNVVAPLGTAFTVDQARLLRRFASDAVILFDGDAAGQKATRGAREPARTSGLRMKVAVLPNGTDPDDLARKRGIDSVKNCVKSARGMLEHLIDVALDATFTQSDAYERLARVEQVSKLLTEEDDPLVRSLAKTYADQLAGRLDLAGSRASFHALEGAVRKALAMSGRLPQGRVDHPRKARIAPKLAGAGERREIVGCIIEYPALLQDSEVILTLELLEGVAAQVVVAIRKVVRIDPEGQKTLDSVDFLAQIPKAIHPFASERLAAPHHDTLEDAKTHLLENAQKLRKLVLSNETSELARDQHKVIGDWGAELENAREATDRARLKHGLNKETPKQ